MEEDARGREDNIQALSCFREEVIIVNSKHGESKKEKKTGKTEGEVTLLACLERVVRNGRKNGARTEETSMQSARWIWV